ncbi:ABC transporter permease [Clostridium sp. 19966]|uniref:ABC transporter permease n=1 Tax=Clostridium sp. 19966 TaxID=2768166 RepID=UPI0028DDD3E8|nr:ABC transporter permease [Clostridium sp. 19966]MDT8717450.1 ABC transporter permease [Clostridium sp. 19966]
MIIGRLFKMAMASIWSNKMRAFLTMLGIIIGISSVIVLVGLGQGTKQQVADQIEKLGTNLITVNLMSRRSINISDSEVKALSTKPGIKEIAPVLTGSNVNIKAGDTSTTTSLEASNPNYETVRKLSVQSGRFIQDRDIENRFKVLVIGTETATNLFGTTNVVGQTMYVNGIEFTIVGVLQSEGSSSSGSGDDKIILPLSTAERLLQNTSIKTYYVEAASKDKVDEAMSYIKLFLDKKYKTIASTSSSTSTSSNTNYRIFDQTSLLETASSTTESLTTMLAGTAAISLIVGGIGIMNIMLVSVIERTREIGIRKAIGAKRRSIMMQFIIEAATISTIGGVLGILFGYIGAYLAEKFLNYSILITNNVVMEACLFSVLVGIIFGIYPASKASKLNPIDALRFE